MALEILIIDDDEVVLFLHELFLKDCYDAQSIRTFKNAEAALQYIKFEQKDPSPAYIVILDINMPCLSGWEFMDELKNHPIYKNMYVFMVTSSLDGKDKEMAKNYSCVIGFCEKPLSENICAEIRQYPQLAHLFTL